MGEAVWIELWVRPAVLIKLKLFQLDMAQGVGFEPTIRFPDTRTFQGCRTCWQASAYKDIPLA
jgi:hypothetical protein